MNTQMPTTTPVTDDTEYTVLINEQQRRVIHAALVAYRSANPDGGERDKWAESVAELLQDALDPAGNCGPLQATGVNSLVI